MQAQATFEPLEDELLAIDYLIEYSPFEFIYNAPDATHPGFWYAVMKLIGADTINSIERLRLIQIALYILMSSLAVFLYRKSFPLEFIFSFLLLLLSNIYLVHLTFQFRMYALVIAISFLFSLSWLDSILNQKRIRTNRQLLISFLGIIGFFTNYSFIWIYLFWLLTYIIANYSKGIIRALIHLRTLIITSILSIGWFIPTFFERATKSISANQWSPEFTAKNIFYVFINYFGISVGNIDLSMYFWHGVIIVALLCFMCGWGIVIKAPLWKAFIFSLFIVIALYLITAKLTGNSILYARTSITILICIFSMMSYLILYQKKVSLLICAIVVIQLLQWSPYFMPTENFDKSFHFLSFRINPLHSIAKKNILSQDCILTVPYWNKVPLEFLLERSDVVILDDISKVDAHECKRLVLIEQTTIDNDIIASSRVKLKKFGYEVELQESTRAFSFSLISGNSTN